MCFLEGCVHKPLVLYRCYLLSRKRGLSCIHIISHSHTPFTHTLIPMEPTYPN
uniref:Uncharacterized protein n=1 Tax=Anguilla anguilla TaxID=7936 RepID=A0A0E9RAW4_ANGAN